MRTRILALLSSLLLGGLLMASGQDSSSHIALAVYNEGSALIREQRAMTLAEGINHVTLRDVPATIDPTSINFKSLSDPAGIIILEQSYRHKPLDARALLTPYITQIVEITVSDNHYSGQLIRLGEDKAILQTAPNEIAYINLYDIRGIKFPAPALELQPGPELRLALQSDSASEHEVELAYLASGMNWTADYNVFLNAEESSLDLRGLVTLRNRSGRAFREAALKLVAGEISRIETEEEDFAEARAMRVYSADVGSGGGGVEQRDLGDNKLYAIARPITIEDNETKQIEFVSGAGIAAKTIHVFDSSPAFRGYYSAIDYVEGHRGASADVLTVLEIDTGAESGLGADLPAGRIRVYKADTDGANLLIGENTIDHTPKGEALRVALGTAFDLTGERKQMDFSFVSGRVARETFDIFIRNRKEDAAVEVIVPERLYRWRDWQIIDSSSPFVKRDNASIEFVITVEPGAEEWLSYTVEYRFPAKR